MYIPTKQQKQSISAFYQSLGIKNSLAKEDFWEHVTAIDTLLTQELKPIMNRQKQGDLYEIKNRTLAFSLAVESWTMSFHHSLLTWMNQLKSMKPKRILEIGSDNGLLACWYALLFPEAEIVGIDQCENGIKCAKQLALQLGLNNVQFHQLNFMELTEHYFINSFDFIISVRTFHEIMGPVLISNYWSLPEYLAKNSIYGDSKYLEIVNRLLTENGMYLSCEQLRSTADAGKWANTLKEAGLYVQWEESGTIEYQEVGVNRLTPVIMAAKRETGFQTLEGLELLHTKNQPLLFEEGSSYKWGAAEFAFYKICEKKLLTGTQLKVTNHWHVFRFEIWETDGLLLVYNYGNMGYHQLDILSAGSFEKASCLMEEAVKEFGHLGPIVWYNSLEERPM